MNISEFARQEQEANDGVAFDQSHARVFYFLQAASDHAHVSVKLAPDEKSKFRFIYLASQIDGFMDAFKRNTSMRGES